MVAQQSVDRPEPEIRYEDEAVVVVSKPAGWVVHPGSGNLTGTLVDWLMQRWPNLKKTERAGLVHRLDKGTSGLVLVAKTDGARTAISQQFADRTVEKRYLALVKGVPMQPRGAILAPITRHHADRKKMAVRPDGKAAETRYEIIENFPQVALLEVEIKTGRTHQIRVHLAALGHPIIGDPTYGDDDAKLGRPFLHASRLVFSHPDTGKRIAVTDPLPSDLKAFLGQLR